MQIKEIPISHFTQVLLTVIDKEGDDQTTLFGVEHKNPNLFRDTFLGKFKPVTGAFMTGNSSVYFTQVLKDNMELVL
jgi:hypothetical protein